MKQVICGRAGVWSKRPLLHINMDVFFPPSLFTTTNPYQQNTNIIWRPQGASKVRKAAYSLDIPVLSNI
jgi:hypothetical protein